MAKFSGPTAAPTRVDSPIQTTGQTAVNHEGQAGYARDAKSELYTLAVANMVGEDTFYEGASERDQRFRELVRQISKTEPDWIARLIPYLRNEMNMRSATIVVAAEFAHARKGMGRIGAAGEPTIRKVVDSACVRADEPAEFVGYWLSRFGRSMPSAVKRGLADAVARLYTERNALKYDGSSRTIRMADVIELTHPKPAKPWQADLYRWLIDVRHNRAEVTIPETLPMLRVRERLELMPVPERRRWLVNEPAGAVQTVLGEAGMTWESLSGWLQGPMDAAAWEAVIPNMGYMALMRNLRNFNQAGISADVKTRITARLMNPEEVSRSRQFPFRFLSAYKAIEGDLEYSFALERALNDSLSNVPSLGGRSLILIDWSGSMRDRAGGKMSDMSRGEVATLFGVALGLRAEEADMVAFGSTGTQYKLVVKPGTSILPVASQWRSLGGTDTLQAVQRYFRPGYHNRVIVITDEQYTGNSRLGIGYGYGRSNVDPLTPVSANVPAYIWNLGGYAVAQSSSDGMRHTFAGLTDKAFAMIPLLERGQNQGWPF